MESNNKERNWLENCLLPKILDKIVKTDMNSSDQNKAIHDHKISIQSITIKYLGSDEAFMLTTCYRAVISFTFNDKLYTEYLVVKKTPVVSKDAYDSVNFDLLFHNEITAYTKILPALALILGENIQKYPKYYYSERKTNEACIVLGDFNANGWQMTKNKVNLSLEHIILAVTNLGKFHGTAYALKMLDSKKFTELVKTFRDSKYEKQPPPQWALVLKYSVQRAFRAAQNYYPGQISSDFYDKLNILLDDSFQYSKIRLSPSEPYATICHGDYLRNNIAFKYTDEKDNTSIPIDVLMFDFQTLRYASPMMDLVTFMCLSAGHQIRPLHFNQIFKCYWDNLTGVIEEITHIKPLPEFLSYENMLKEFIRYLPYGLSVASSFLMILYDTRGFSAEEVLNTPPTEEQMFEDMNTRGGKDVDKELGALVHELYNFTLKYNIDLFGKT